MKPKWTIETQARVHGGRKQLVLGKDVEKLVADTGGPHGA